MRVLSFPQKPLNSPSTISFSHFLHSNVLSFPSCPCATLPSTSSNLTCVVHSCYPLLHNRFLFTSSPDWLTPVLEIAVDPKLHYPLLTKFLDPYFPILPSYLHFPSPSRVSCFNAFCFPPHLDLPLLLSSCATSIPTTNPLSTPLPCTCQDYVDPLLAVIHITVTCFCHLIRFCLDANPANLHPNSNAFNLIP